MKKFYIFIIPLIAFLYSCSSSVTDLEDLEVKVDNLTYVKGEKHPFSGRSIKRGRNGGIEQEMSYKNGLPHGTWKLYCNNGLLSIWGVYKDGKTHGKWRLYYEDGKILAEEGYLNGEKNGRNRYFSHEGVLIEEINYVRGKLHGTHKVWDKEGRLIKEVLYIEGEEAEKIKE